MSNEMLPPEMMNEAALPVAGQQTPEAISIIMSDPSVKGRLK